MKHVLQIQNKKRKKNNNNNIGLLEKNKRHPKAF